MMTTLLNQFSYPLIALGVLASAFLLLRLRQAKRATLIVVEVGLLAAFVGGFFALRTGDGDLRDMAAYDALIANQRPTLVEFFSNFCTGCLVMRPSVDALVQDLEGEFNILRVNIHSDAGRDLRERLGFSFTPEFIVLDARGVEVWRGHTVPTLTDLQRAQ
ncbi:MAG: thioredoxin domain-containing protein [Anaerolineae bacterium]|nr:thioredoxin domain-containing protein [Anaerolineae bacterium]